MIDQSTVNLLDLIPTKMKRVASTNGGEYHGACPMCGGKDRFVVQPNAKPNPRWFCRKCNEKGGDAIAFIMENRNCDFKSAVRELNLQVDANYNQKPRKWQSEPSSLPYSREKSTGSDSDKWQDRAHKFIDYAESKMWGDDRTGLDYLYNRGFYDKTIEVNRLGYNPQNLWDDWGLDKKAWLPYGIVIPYERGEHATITKIRTRRLDYKDGDTTGKYIPPAGVKNTAYLTRRLLVGDYVLIVESELDAIIFKQEVTEPRFVAMATGGTHGAKLLKYLALLALAHIVIVAFDCDESGEKASQYWLNALPNTVRLAPYQHDINDMVLANDSLHQWLREVL